jgi:hypothetical protein
MADNSSPLKESADLITDAERLLREAKELQTLAESVGRQIKKPDGGKIQ